MSFSFKADAGGTFGTLQLNGLDVVKIVPSGIQPTFQTLTDAVTIAWDMSLGPVGSVTLAGSRTMGLPTNMSPGSYMLIVKQDATGSRLLTWNAAFKWAGGAAPVLSTAANAVDMFSFFYDGSVMYGSYLRGMA